MPWLKSFARPDSSKKSSGPCRSRNASLNPPTNMLKLEITPPWYAARPINGGPLFKAQPKRGDWDYESKINGWRAWVFVPTGDMFNRFNQPLSITGQFSYALRALRDQFATFPSVHGWNRCDWADVEGLERRHNLGKGSLIVLDIPNPMEPAMPYTARNDFLQSFFAPLNDPGSQPCGLHEVRCLKRFRDPLTLWQSLQAENQRLGCEFYEGVVAKRADSVYPMQLHSPDAEFPFWMKHRWRF